MEGVTLAGRERELAALRRRLTSPQPGVLVICGEAGIGTSRLLRAGPGGEPGVSALAAVCLPLTEKVPLLPIGDVLRSALAIDGGQWLERNLEAGPAPH